MSEFITEWMPDAHLYRERIVRCRDCKKCNVGWCVHFNSVVKPDGFCAWGERRDDNA